MRPPGEVIMKITARTALELASHEGLVRQAYKDSVGVWTWSIGITDASGHKVERYINNPQPLQKCLDVYVWALEKYANDVRKVFEDKPLNEHQFAAAVSFHYNTGAISRATWVKKWLAGDVAGAKKSFMDWSKPKEIVPRRQKERDLFFDGKWSNNGTVTEYTRVKANGQIDWACARKTNIKDAIDKVFDIDVKPPAETNSEPKNPLKSKRGLFWTAVFSGTPLAAIGVLHWSVQLAIVVGLMGIALYSIYSMPYVRNKIKHFVEDVL